MSYCSSSYLSVVDRPWFHENERDGLKILLPQIDHQLTNLVVKMKNLKQNERSEFSLLNRIYFITDVNRSELEGTQTLEETEAALENPATTTTQIVSKNLARATDYLFRCRPDFNSELAKTVHKMVCSGLFALPGTYRTCDARPAGNYHFFYTNPCKIEQEISVLFTDCRRMLPLQQTLSSAVNVASYFLNRFLAIHPFSDGNGRTGKLLLAWLLHPLLIEPFVPTLNTTGSRNIYLQCLEEARTNKPELLSSFILLSLERTINLWNEFLDCV